MKVGTDGVLLGAWVNLNKATTLLDVGTGTGVIALMLAQRTTSAATITAVELEHDAFLQAVENVALSPWPEKVVVAQSAIQNYFPNHKFDLIVSNPPYFQNSQKPPDEKRELSRHTVTLSFLELIEAVQRLLTDQGKFNVILPNHEGMAFVDLAAKNNFYCSRQWAFRTRQEKPVERWLLEFSRQPTIDKEKGEIVLYKAADVWSDTYKSLTRAFYLKA